MVHGRIEIIWFMWNRDVWRKNTSGNDFLLLAGMALNAVMMERNTSVPSSRSEATSLWGSCGGSPDMSQVISSL